jgi:Flp pilus assembly secretin CpaC
MRVPPFAFLALLGFAAAPVHAQYGQEMALLHSPAYEAAAAPLRSAPPRQYNFSKAVLSDVMRLMAEDAGIGFFGLPDGNGGGDNLVTFTLNASPFSALETLAKANGVALIYDGGIWYLRPANDQELIGRIYEINYNAQELVTKNNQSMGMGGGMGGGNIGGGGGFGGGGGGFGAGGGAAGLNLQGSPDFFVIEPSRILEDIQNILNIPTTGGNASFAPTASVDNVAQLSVGGFQGQPDLVVRQPVAAGTGGVGGEPVNQSKVIWNSDSNTLYVVATRQQHQWIEAYLASADRPQPMIAVEVKFIETSRDPSSDLGIDWNGVLGQNGLEVSLTDASGPIDLNSVGNYSLPTAVLSYSDLNVKLRAIYNDRKTRMVSYPRMVTLDNREVSFRSVVNQPVLGSSASASLGAGATETSAIEYLPIGTVINVLPKRMAGNKILLNVSVTVSDIIGTEIINGNPFPIATSRVYTAPLTVQSGYTVAISGLDAARVDENESGLPILGRLPVIGYAFKNRRQDRNRQHLMMLITPVALNTGTEGLTEKPITREPWKAAPPVHQPVVYDKVPVQQVQERPRVQAQPIGDIPDFNEVVSNRKASRSFGKTGEAEAAPEFAEVEEREPAGNASSMIRYPDPLPAENRTKTVEVPANASTLAPVPSSLNTPMMVTRLPSDAGPEPVTAKLEPAPAEPAPAKPAPATPAPAVSAPSLPAAPAPAPAPVAAPAKPAIPAPPIGSGASSAAPAKPVASAPAAKTATSPATTVPAQSSPAPKAATARAEEPSDPRLSEIRKGIDRLEADLGKIPNGEGKLSPDDGQLVLNVHEEAQKLLGEVEAVRGDKSKPLSGSLGDSWWDLINLKSRAAKLSRRSPESLAVTNGEGGKQDGAPTTEPAPAP